MFWSLHRTRVWQRLRIHLKACAYTSDCTSIFYSVLFNVLNSFHSLEQFYCFKSLIAFLHNACFRLEIVSTSRYRLVISVVLYDILALSVTPDLRPCDLGWVHSGMYRCGNVQDKVQLKFIYLVDSFAHHSVSFSRCLVSGSTMVHSVQL